MGKTAKSSNVGRAELEILRFITEKHPVSVREVAEHFGETKGLVRTTVLNVMERLRKKGFLVRRQTGGIFQYSPKLAKGELLRNLVRDFVSRTLGGSISPFVAYLAEEAEMTNEEIAELRKVVRELNKGE